MVGEGYLEILGRKHPIERIEFKISPFAHGRDKGFGIYILAITREPEPMACLVDELDVRGVESPTGLDGKRIHLFQYNRMEDDTLDSGSGALPSSCIGKWDGEFPRDDWGFERLIIDFRYLAQSKFNVSMRCGLYPNYAESGLEETEASLVFDAPLREVASTWS